MNYAHDSPEARSPAIICDMDGTLVDVRSIRHLVQRASATGAKLKPNYDAFHAASFACPPHNRVIRFLRLARALGFAIVIVTAREERWSFLTSLWLYEHDVVYDSMFMRQMRDYRPDKVVKGELEKLITRRFEVRAVLDDRQEIIDVWKAAGHRTIRITESGGIESQ